MDGWINRKIDVIFLSLLVFLGKICKYWIKFIFESLEYLKFLSYIIEKY